MQAPADAPAFVAGLDEQRPDILSCEIGNREPDNPAIHFIYPSASIFAEHLPIVPCLDARRITQYILAHAQADPVHLRDIALNGNANVHRLSRSIQALAWSTGR